MKLAIGCDEAAYRLKVEIMKHLDDTQVYEIEEGKELEDIDYCESIQST